MKVRTISTQGTTTVETGLCYQLDQIHFCQHLQFPVKQTVATQGPTESPYITTFYSAIHNSQQLMNLVSAAVSI